MTDQMNQLIIDGVVCRTAPASPGLLKMLCVYFHTSTMMISKVCNGKGASDRFYRFPIY